MLLQCPSHEFQSTVQSYVLLLLLCTMSLVHRLQCHHMVSSQQCSHVVVVAMHHIISALLHESSGLLSLCHGCTFNNGKLLSKHDTQKAKNGSFNLYIFKFFSAVLFFWPSSPLTQSFSFQKLFIFFITSVWPYTINHIPQFSHYIEVYLY